MVVAEVLVETRSKWVMVMQRYDGLYTVSELKTQSLISRNTLGDTILNSNKLKQNWVGFSWRKCIVVNVDDDLVAMISGGFLDVERP